MEKIKDFLAKSRSNKRKLFALLSLVGIMSVSMGSIAFAESTTTDFSAVTTALTGAFTVGEIASVIGVVLASGVGFVIFWWGARKLVRGVISAFKSGKLRF